MQDTTTRNAKRWRCETSMYGRFDLSGGATDAPPDPQSSTTRPLVRGGHPVLPALIGMLRADPAAPATRRRRPSPPRSTSGLDRRHRDPVVGGEPVAAPSAPPRSRRRPPAPRVR